MTEEQPQEQAAESEAQQTALDAEGEPLFGHEYDGVGNVAKPGTRVRIVHMDDPNLAGYVGQEGTVEWAQEVPPHEQVMVVFAADRGFAPISTQSKWVRKVGE